MRRYLLVLISVLSSACSTTPSLPPVIERQPPSLCLVPVTVTQACVLPEWFDRATLADKAALILACKQVDVAMILERDARLSDCKGWFAVNGADGGD